ncbi:MAG: diacylglycerol kinase family protein [Longimicrobiales bacterium]
MADNALPHTATATQPAHERQVALICNPKSGRVKKRLAQVRAAGEALAGTNYMEASSPEEVAAALSAVPLTGPGCLGVVGGDGTVQAVLTALHCQHGNVPWPTLFVAPGGSTNMTAKDLGGPGSVLKALDKLNRWTAGRGPEGTLVRRSVLSVDREGQDPVLGMFFGLGLISEGVGFFRENLRGHAYAGEHTSLLSVGRVLLSFGFGAGRRDYRRQTLTRTVDDSPSRTHQGALCLVTSLERLLFGTRPYWGTGPGPLHFTLVEAEADGIWRNLPRFARGRAGRRMSEDRGYFSQNASVVELTFEGPFVVDGELFEASTSSGPCRLTAPHTPNWLVL